MFEAVLLTDFRFVLVLTFPVFGRFVCGHAAHNGLKIVSTKCTPALLEAHQLANYRFTH